MARPEKVAEVELLTEKMQNSEGLILADPLEPVGIR